MHHVESGPGHGGEGQRFEEAWTRGARAASHMHVRRDTELARQLEHLEQLPGRRRRGIRDSEAHGHGPSLEAEPKAAGHLGHVFG